MGALAAILKNFEKAMTSAAFAEEGEFDMARQMAAPSKNANKRVLLGVNETKISLNTLRYALNLCRRLGAKLEILHVLRPEKSGGGKTPAGRDDGGAVPAPLHRALGKKDIAYQLVFADSGLVKEVAGQVEKRRDIVCVVFDASEAEETRCLPARKKLGVDFQKVKCPVVAYGQPVNA